MISVPHILGKRETPVSEIRKLETETIAESSPGNMDKLQIAAKVITLTPQRP